MSYQVLARKYRPQQFADVIGQEHVTRTLMNALTTGRIHHAYLFTGARGIGKTTVARLLAKALNCEKGPEGEPCNACRSCDEITAGSSLDVQEIDGASNTGVDDVREIRERVRYMPTGRYKIYIIDEVHMLSTSAFNALLKTLEEPPPHAVFIFATTEAHKIPATILSRCQRYDFRRIPSPRMAQALGVIAGKEGVTIEPEALAMIAREAAGSLRDGQSLLDQAVAYAGKSVNAASLRSMLGLLDRGLLLDLVGAIVRRDARRGLAILDEMYQSGADLAQMAASMIEMLRNLLVIKVAGTDAAGAELPPGEAETLGGIGDAAGSEELERMFGIWYAGAEQIARSPMPKMVAEVLVIRMCNIAPVTSLADIFARIDGLVGTAAESDASSSTAAGAATALAEEKSRPAPARQSAAVSDPGANWDAFMRWLASERPQVASVLAHGTMKRFENGVVTIEFAAPLYADMVMEADRKTQIVQFMERFFKRPVTIEATTVEGAGGEASIAVLKQRTTKEALDSPLVKQAAEIFDAKVHEVKTRAGEKG